MVESLVNWFTTVFAGIIPAELLVFLLSMLPVLELRGGLIAASILGIPLGKAIGICFVGNLIPVPFILILIRPIFRWLKMARISRPLVSALERKAMGKSDTIRRYEFWGLLIFVGIPLPGTGAWTGALIASMLNISIKRAMPPIILGMGMATVIMTFVSYVLPYLVLQA